MAERARFDFKKNIAKALKDGQLRKNLRSAMNWRNCAATATPSRSGP